MNAVGIIPARFAASRFPGKALAPIAGTPMLQRVIAGARKARSLREVVVATDDERIAEAARAVDAPVLLTGAHPTGTDRVAEAARARSEDIVVNIQGDEPLMEGFVIDAAVAALAKRAAHAMATLAHEASAAALHDANRVKVVRAQNGDALYFSRSAIPFMRAREANAQNNAPILQHIGLYAYRREFLQRFVGLAQTPLERAEQLEQLRALEHGFAIHCALIEGWQSTPVDCPEDIARAEAALRTMNANLRIGLLFFLALLVGAMWLATFASKRQERVIAGVVPLETQHFEALTLVTLGTGGSFENHHRRGPALLVGAGESALLVDAGRGVSEALRAAGIPVQQPRHVLLSSLLPENVLGLDDLWLDAWLARAETPLHVYGPPGTAQFIAQMQSAHAAGARAMQNAWALEAQGGRIIAHEVTSETKLSVSAFEVTSVAITREGAVQRDADAQREGAPQRGTGAQREGAAQRAVTMRSINAPPMAARGWRITERARPDSHAIVTAFGGADADSIARIARGAALLVIEAVYDASLALAEEAGLSDMAVLRREAARHPRLEDVGALAARAGAQAIVLVRLRPPPVFAFQYERLVAASFRRGPVFVAADGDRFTP